MVVRVVVKGTDGRTCQVLADATVQSWQADALGQYNAYCSNQAVAKVLLGFVLTS
jgi:protocatechuate 3,4-dioxygenase beta subunit